MSKSIMRAPQRFFTFLRPMARSMFLNFLRSMSGLNLVSISIAPLSYHSEWYVNGAIEIETKFKPDMLLKKFKNIERAMGRKKVKKRWGARIIDLDILLYDALVVKKKTLRIPHPEMPNRKFVLVPLSEIAPQVIHPELGVTISELLVNVKDEKKVHLYHS